MQLIANSWCTIVRKDRSDSKCIGKDKVCICDYIGAAAFGGGLIALGGRGTGLS